MRQQQQQVTTSSERPNLAFFKPQWAWWVPYVCREDRREPFPEYAEKIRRRIPVKIPLMELQGWVLDPDTLRKTYNIRDF